MRNLLVGMFLVLVAASTNAAQLSFKFDVNSSGSSMYACDAGLKHTTDNVKVCYDRVALEQGNAVSCTPDFSCGTGDDCNCVCTGGYGVNQAGSVVNNNQGNYRLDYMKASVADWTDNGDIPLESDIATYNVEANESAYNFNTVSGVSTKSVFKQQITDLEFNLGSEKYGAEYYVDICFRATQITYGYTGSSISWTANGGVTISDIVGDGTDNFTFDGTNTASYSTEAYQTLSGLEVKAELVCIAKDGCQVITDASPYASIPGQYADLVSGSADADLKACKFRYSFKENVVLSSIDSIRKWKLQRAQICTDSSVNEPLN